MRCRLPHVFALLLIAVASLDAQSPQLIRLGGEFAPDQQPNAFREDFDGDGDIDFLTLTSSYQGAFSVRLNDGAGRFVVGPQTAWPTLSVLSSFTIDLRLAFTPPDPERATVGGVIAAATEGPSAAGSGLVRDQLLGVLAVTGDGKLVKAGGRVVKNVTGYDLVRLYTGSRGALAILLETTVRLRPRPEALWRGVFTFADERSALAAGLAVRSKTAGLARLAVFGGAATVDLGISAHWALVAEAEGFAQSARAAVLAAAERIDVEGTLAALPIDADLPFLAPEEASVVRVTAPPDRWTHLRETLGACLGSPAGVVHDVLRGVRDTWHDPAARIWVDDRALDQSLTAAGATIDRPRDAGFHRELLRRLPGQSPGGLPQMRLLKAAFDPAGILNPGRTIFG